MFRQIEKLFLVCQDTVQSLANERLVGWEQDFLPPSVQKNVAVLWDVWQINLNTFIHNIPFPPGPQTSFSVNVWPRDIFLHHRLCLSPLDIQTCEKKIQEIIFHFCFMRWKKIFLWQSYVFQPEIIFYL